ncbi:hypothetical protein G7Y79_00041g077870 [Physcia stellaris]|nr:hypothetical protein G7Y79_00041g077870 [Physcia stellaris]
MQGLNRSKGSSPEQPQKTDISAPICKSDILVLFLVWTHILITSALILTTIIVFIRSKPALTKRIALLTRRLEDYKALLPDREVAATTTCTQALIADTEKEIQWLTKMWGEGVEKRGPFYFVYWWKNGGVGWKVDGAKQGGLEEKGVEPCPSVSHASGEEDFEWVVEKHEA